MKKLYWFIFILVIALTLGCASRLNENSPAYIKKVAAYKEALDGLMIYFILADQSGAMTTSDGEGKIKILEVYPDRAPGPASEFILYSAKFTPKKELFERARVGRGAFDHEAILLSLGRVPYSEFPLKPKSKYGKVQIDFQRPDGKILKGEAEITF